MQLTEEQLALVRQWSGLPFWAVRRWPGLAKAIGRDDAAGIAFLALCRAAESYKPGLGTFRGHARAWIYYDLLDEASRGGIVRRKSGGKYGRPPLVTHTGCDFGRLAGREDGQRQAEATGTAIDVRAAVDALPARLRRVVEEVFYAGRTAADYAREIGLTRSRVLQMKDEALARMRPALAALSGVESQP